VENDSNGDNIKYTICFDDLDINDLGELKNKKGFFFLKCKDEPNLDKK